MKEAKCPLNLENHKSMTPLDYSEMYVYVYLSVSTLDLHLSPTLTNPSALPALPVQQVQVRPPF